MVAPGGRRRTAAERLIAAVADDVDMARYEEPSHAPDVVLKAAEDLHWTLLRIATEARGLETITHGRGFVAVRGRRVVVGALNMTAPSTSMLARGICGNKPMTLRLLRMAGVPVPEGRSFRRGEPEKAVEYTRELGWPVVLKPGEGRAGKGVVIGIRSDQELRSAWKYTVGAMSEKDRRVIVEREHDGVDVRVYVVGDQAVAGVVRLPAHVRGDGQSTIEALVEEANRERRGNPYLRRLPIRLDEESDRHLESRGLKRESVPERTEIVLLRRTANIHLGGVSVDVTDELPVALADAAVRAAEAIPGLDAVGVDFLVPDVRSPDGAVVLELNSNANICMAHYPVAGEPRDVAGAIVDRTLSVFG